MCAAAFVHCWVTNHIGLAFLAKTDILQQYMYSDLIGLVHNIDLNIIYFFMNIHSGHHLIYLEIYLWIKLNDRC